MEKARKLYNVTISRKNWMKKAREMIQCNDFTEKSAGRFKTFILYHLNVAQDSDMYTGTVETETKNS